MNTNEDIISFLKERYEEHEYKDIILYPDFAKAFIGTLRRHSNIIAVYDVKKCIRIINAIHFGYENEDNYLKSAKIFDKEFSRALADLNAPLFINLTS